MKTPIRLAIAATAATLAACATPYKPDAAWRGGGFSEQRREPGVYEVWFAGNEHTSEDRSEDLAVLRAAELCLGERKAFMLTSDFQTHSVFSGFRPPYAILRSVPVAPTTGNPPSPVPRTVGMIPSRERFAPRSGLQVECLDQPAENAQESAAVASTIRERYGIR